jgi:hypothetical protein
VSSVDAATPLVVSRLRDLPPLVIEDGLGVASFFFEKDASARAGGYDEWVAANNRDRFERHDVETINGTMRARSGYEAWKPLFGESPPWLTEIHPDWDLLEVTPQDWSSIDCCRLICVAIEKMSVMRVGRAMATKVLHMKRPLLVPILDSLVVETVGGRAGESPTPTDVLVDHLRAVTRDNAAALTEIQGRLHCRAIQPSRVRILGAILWTVHPQSSLHASLGWPIRIGPGSVRTRSGQS